MGWKLAQERVFNYQPGLGSVGAYQASGKPWVTSYTAVATVASAGDATEILFPSVTRWIAISMEDATAESALRIGFSRHGVESLLSQTNYYLLWNSQGLGAAAQGAAQTVTFEVKCNAIYIAGHANVIDNVSVMAGLTSISNGEIITNWSGSVGVG